MKLENGELKQKLHPNNFLKEKYTSVNICDERSEDIYTPWRAAATVRNLNIKEWRESFSRFPLMCFNETGNYVQERGNWERDSISHTRPISTNSRYNIHETNHKSFDATGINASEVNYTYLWLVRN